MKTRIHKLIMPLLALCALIGGAARVNAQVSLTVDPSQPWIGYMNIFALPVNGGGYLTGSVWGTPDLRAAFIGATNLLLQPNTNVWDPANAFYVQPDGVTPNTIMDASFYVQNDILANTNLVFTGKCLSNTLTANPEPLTGVSYTSQAFIKIFDAGYALLGSATSNLVAGQSFSISLNTTGATHVQYGFETIGPDASPATASALGNVVVAVAPPTATVTVDPTQLWQGFMNVFSLPADGGGYQFGNPWGTSDLRALFSGTTNLTLLPCTNVWNPTDSYWVKPDGVTPNKLMDASMYVQSQTLTNTNVVFVGTCLANTLTNSPEPLTGVRYTSVAFIKTFDPSFNLLGSTTVPLVPGQSFAIILNTTGSTYVQYGFETIGPDASTATSSSLGNVVLAAGIPPSPTPVPTNNAPTPTHAASSVLAMFNSSGTYTNHAPERWLAAWSGSAFNNYTIPATGRVVLKYSSLQYAGVEFYNNDPTSGAGGDNVGGATNYAINATPYDTFHVDVWTPNANQFGVQLVSINPTEGPQVDFLPAGGTITNDGWISLNIPLTTFTGINPSLNLANLQQMLWIDNQAGGGVTGGTFYIDNVYFFNSAVAAPPTISASLSGGSIHLSFPTQNGSNYDVQFKNSLSDAVWQTLSTTPGDGSVHTVPDPTTHASRFYRLFVH
jgi:hypothetical protein